MKTSVRLVLAGLAVTFLLAAAANAQRPRFDGKFEGKFTLPYEAHWKQAVLPAGEYSLTIDSTGLPLVARVWATDKKRGPVFVAFMITSVTAGKKKGPSALFITQSGKQNRVRSVNVAELGMLLIYEPYTKHERELIKEARDTQTVPIIAAGSKVSCRV